MKVSIDHIKSNNYNPCVPRSKKTYEYHMKIFGFYKAGMTTMDIAQRLHTSPKVVRNSFEYYKEMYLPEQVCFGRKKESQDENMYSGVLPKYNSYELSGEELEIFNEGALYCFKLDYEKE
jgi:hypothetical protein